jgi:tetratricopeptide (TPR) repeat protein
MRVMQGTRLILSSLLILTIFATPGRPVEPRAPDAYPPLAEEDLKQRILLNPEHTGNFQLYLDLGKKYFGDNNYPEAIKALKQTVLLAPSSIEAYFLLGKSYRLLGKHNEALQAFNRLIRLTPTDALAHQFLGLIYINLNRYEEAAEEFSKAALLNPGWAERYYDHFDNVHKEFYNTEVTMAIVQILNRKDPPLAKLIWENHWKIFGSSHKTDERIWPLPPSN